MTDLTDEWRAQWNDWIAERGQEVTLRRLPATDAVVKAIVRGYRPEELVGGINQGAREVIVLAGDLEALGWPVPPKSGDRVILRSGRPLMVDTVDSDTLNLAGVDIGYKLSASG
jgi:hypothetical protein